MDKNEMDAEADRGEFASDEEVDPFLNFFDLPLS
jgi:hypothetical protein